MSETPRFADMVGMRVEIEWKGDPGQGFRSLYELVAVDRDFRMIALRGLEEPERGFDEMDSHSWFPLEDVEMIAPEDL